MNFPEDVRYHSEHMWVRLAVSGEAEVGVTDFAQDQLGKVIYVDMPEVGQDITAGGEMGAVESAKVVSDLIAPVSGVVTAVNPDLEDDPELLNNDPYGAWIARVSLKIPGEVDELMDAGAYQKLIG